MSVGVPRPFQIVLHCHQPAGNLPAVLEEAYGRCYEPLLEILARFEDVKVCLHFSGALLEHAVGHRPGFIERLQTLERRRQVELLGGGFYEPILPVLSDADARGQLEMMALLLQKHFGVRPKGAWLTERVWEPDLPRILGPAGARFTYVDDHLLRVGMPDDRPVDGYWVTEKAGQLLALFGVDRSLRYRIPSEDPASILDYIVQAPGDGVVTFADDGEKLGLWPGSHGWVHVDGWLERFMLAMQAGQAEGRLQTVLPTEYLERTPPRGRAYLPSGSYEELEGWALGPEGARLERLAALVGDRPSDRAHLRGGSWRDFLVRYPEAGWLHGRMLAVSERLQAALEEAMATHRGRPLPSALQDRLGTAQRDLYRAQGADPYWRGLFGGVHLPFLRADAHSAVLRAEHIIDGVQQGDEEWVSYEERDLDLDGELEVSLSNRGTNVHVRPHEGGAIVGWDDKLRGWCLTDVLAHRVDRAVEDSQDGLRGFDDGMRLGFLDRFLPSDGAVQAQAEAANHDLGDLARARAQITGLSVDEGQTVSAQLGLRLRGSVDGRPVVLDKRYTLELEGAHLEVSYLLRNEGDAEVATTFAPELSLALSSEARLRCGGSGGWSTLEGEHALTGEATIEDPERGIRMTWDLSLPARLVAYPIHTDCHTPNGQERIRQGVGLSFGFGLNLPAGEDVALRLSVDLSEAKG